MNVNVDDIEPARRRGRSFSLNVFLFKAGQAFKVCLYRIKHLLIAEILVSILKQNETIWATVEFFEIS